MKTLHPSTGENSLVATENYNHPFIAIEKMIFPSLPLIYAFLSLGCHSVTNCTTFGGALLSSPSRQSLAAVRHSITLR